MNTNINQFSLQSFLIEILDNLPTKLLSITAKHASHQRNFSLHNRCEWKIVEKWSTEFCSKIQDQNP